MHIYKTILTAALLMACTDLCRGQQNGAGNGFAVLELFTSEGCSSCPAADKILTQFQEEYKNGVYVMEFHVDYWNYIGWKDVFSSELYTKRQQHYSSVFGLSSTYTPQLIINGVKEMVGSDAGKIKPLIDQNLKTLPKATLSIAATTKGSKVSVIYTIDNTKGQLLNVAMVQKRAEVNVKRGENGGRKLTHTNIVRELKTILLTELHGAVEVELPQGAAAEDCRIIAYTQKKDNWQVTSGAQCDIVAESH